MGDSDKPTKSTSPVEGLFEMAGKFSEIYGFKGSHGGSVDVIGGTNPRAVEGAQGIMASLHMAGKNLALQSGLGALVAASMSVPLMGGADATTVFLGACAGGIGSLSQGSKKKPSREL
jgi:hypothetical protein